MRIKRQLLTGLLLACSMIFSQVDAVNVYANEPGIIEETTVYESGAATEAQSDEITLSGKAPSEEETTLTENGASEDEMKLTEDELPKYNMTLIEKDLSENEVTLTEEAPSEDEKGVDAADDRVIEPDGYVYPEETKYHITFIIMSEGEIYKQEEYNNLTSPANMSSTLNLETINKIKMRAGANDILGWQLSVNGHYSTDLTANFRKQYPDEDYLFQPKMDYTLTAKLKRGVSSNIFVDAIPAVYYDGRAHIGDDELLTEKDLEKKLNDLNVHVCYLPDGAPYEDATLLRAGKDYKLTYKNNINASMRMTDDGTYERLELSDKKRPCVLVTGVNNYEGFSAEVYFDILPYNFGEISTVQKDLKFNAQLGGVETSYTLKNGKISKQIDPKVTIRNLYNGKVTTLKKGRDYEIRLYRYNEISKWVLKTDVTETGRWLCTVRGKGNYCGTLFGQPELALNTIFNDGSQPGALNPAVCEYTGATIPAGQFRVENSDRDISKVKVSVAKSSVPYNHGKYYSGKDFGIKVQLGGNILTEGTDYRIIYDGVDFEYFSGKKLPSGPFTSSKSNALYNDKIWMANKYNIIIEAIAGNSNGYYGRQETKKSVTVKGVKINPGWFKLSNGSEKYDGSYKTGGIFKYNPKMKVKIITDSVDSYLTGYYSDSGSYRTYRYMDGVEAVFNNSSKKSAYYDYAVVVVSDYAKLPGSYKRRVIPFGPGVDHSFEANVGFKIKPITMKEAISNGIIKVIPQGKTTYNAGGNLPHISIVFNGSPNDIYMNYNNESVTVYDDDWDSITVKLTIGGSAIPSGKGNVTITAVDNKTITGSASKLSNFEIVCKTINTSPIKVLEDGDFVVEYGKKTALVPVTASEPIGTIYAMMQPVAADKNGKFPSKSQIDLYQSYYADQDGYNNDHAALKKLSPKQYKLTTTPSGTNSFKVEVSNGANGDVATTGLNFVGNIPLSRTYDVFDESATITSVTVGYEGKTYTLPTDSNKLKTVYTGRQVRFDSVEEIRIKSKTDGEVTVPVSDCTITYGANVKAGKNAGQMTVTVKKGTAGYKYGATKTFNFNIESTPKVTM